MATKKKIVEEIIEQDSTQNKSLREDEVFDMLSFAKAYYGYASGSNTDFSQFTGTFTPYLTNERLSEIGLSAKNIDQKSLDSILSSPITNQSKLIGYSEYLKFTDMIAKRALSYLGNLPSFDYSFTCTNIKDASDYNSKAYKDDLAIVKDFLSRFDVRGQFSSVTRRMLEIDSYYCCLRTDDEKYVFQELPYNYCKITGKNSDWGYQFDFDMGWFLKMGLSFDQYPRIFKDMYDNVMSNKFGEKYDPSNPLKVRKGTYSLWSQTSSLPTRGNFACFKFNSDMYATMPYLAPMFRDAINKPIYRELQTNQYMIAAQKILIGLIPLLKDQKSGQIKDALAVKAETLGKFLGLLKRGLSDCIKITGAPFEDVKQVQFDLPTTSIYDQSNATEAANSGVTSHLVYSTSTNPSATEIIYNSNVDEIIANSVYPMFACWLSSQVNFFTKKFKFNFMFEGSNTPDNREKRLDRALKLADKGIVDFQRIASAIGEDIFTLEEKLSFSENSSIWNKLRLLPNANTSRSNTDEAGRPATDTPADSTGRKDDFKGGL